MCYNSSILMYCYCTFSHQMGADCRTNHNRRTKEKKNAHLIERGKYSSLTNPVLTMWWFLIGLWRHIFGQTQRFAVCSDKYTRAWKETAVIFDHILCPIISCEVTYVIYLLGYKPTVHTPCSHRDVMTTRTYLMLFAPSIQCIYAYWNS